MKYRLLAPGPTPVPHEVLRALSKPLVHHRTPAFENIFEKCRKGLQWLFQTEYDVLSLCTSGTGAFEAAFQNFFSPGDTVINVGGGKFGERWGKMAKNFGLEVIDIHVPWGEAAEVAKVATALEEHPEAKALICVASETSTGVRHPYEALGRLVAEKESCLFLVDAITALAVWDISPERDLIDVLVTGSQKALMLPPGLAFMSVSPKAWKANEKAKMPRFYFDLHKERLAQAKNQTAFTPAVSMYNALEVSLEMLQEEGLEHLFARHDVLSEATQAGITALGLNLFAARPASSLTSVWQPDGLAPDAVYKTLRDHLNITIAGGQDHLKGRIFRIAHLGHIDGLDILTVLAALEIALIKSGYVEFSQGASVAAAQSKLFEADNRV